MQVESLTFPNPSRSHDATKDGVHFWGYDRTFEISFFVGQRALAQLDSAMPPGEVGLLETFDAHRERICEVAGNVYSRRPRGAYVYSYILMASDF